MHPALWVSQSGLDAQQTNMTVTSNNLANVSTNGFKKNAAIFKDLMYQKIRQPGATTAGDGQLPSGLMLGAGVKLSGTEKDFRNGAFERTDRALDMAISGKGFFQVMRPDGTMGYTRDGKFQLNSDGEVVTSEGLRLQPAINIPQDAKNINITSNGIVSVTISGQMAPQEIGPIELVDFINEGGLEPIGDNLYLETNASGAPIVAQAATDGMGSIDQGALEASNVNVVEELVKLIQIQRSYEMNAKSIETVDGMLQYVSQVL